MVKRVFIRVDANETIASGHVMRCLSIADALVSLGAEVSFIVSDENPVQLIKNRGYSCCVLGTDWRNLSEGMEDTAILCQSYGTGTVLLVDTYSLTKEYVDELSASVKVCYLGSKADDLGSLSLLVNYSTDINYKFYEDLYGLRGTRLLLGVDYAPLRPQFAQCFSQHEGGIDSVLITTGNTDPSRIVSKLLERVFTIQGCESLVYEVVVGSMFGNIDEIESIASRHENIHVHQDISDMSGLMSSCDLAISANGTTVYELAAVGIPSITFAMVPEQVSSAESLGKLGATRYVGSLSADGATSVVDRIACALVECKNDPLSIRSLSEQAHKLIDGLGVEKIANELMKL